MHAAQLLSFPKGLLYGDLIHRPILLTIALLLSFGTIPAHAQKGTESKKTPVEQKAPSSPAQKSTITYQLIPGKDHTWSYQILLDNRVIIKQSTPPGMPGNNGFATKKAAEDVAKLVITKMKKGEMPPTVTIDEMKKLKAI